MFATPPADEMKADRLWFETVYLKSLDHGTHRPSVVWDGSPLAALGDKAGKSLMSVSVRTATRYNFLHIKQYARRLTMAFPSIAAKLHQGLRDWHLPRTRSEPLQGNQIHDQTRKPRRCINISPTARCVCSTGRFRNVLFSSYRCEPHITHDANP